MTKFDRFLDEKLLTHHATMIRSLVDFISSMNHEIKK